MPVCRCRPQFLCELIPYLGSLLDTSHQVLPYHMPAEFGQRFLSMIISYVYVTYLRNG